MWAEEGTNVQLILLPKKEEKNEEDDGEREEAVLFPPPHTHTQERVSKRKEERKAPRGVGRLGSIMRGYKRRRFGGGGRRR